MGLKHSRWVPNANEKKLKKRNVHGQREKFAFGTQRNLYSTDFRWGFCDGANAYLSVFRYHHVSIPNAKFHVGGLSQRKDQMQMFLRHSGV